MTYFEHVIEKEMVLHAPFQVDLHVKKNEQEE